MTSTNKPAHMPTERDVMRTLCCGAFCKAQALDRYSVAVCTMYGFADEAKRVITHFESIHADLIAALKEARQCILADQGKAQFPCDPDEMLTRIDAALQQAGDENG